MNGTLIEFASFTSIDTPAWHHGQSTLTSLRLLAMLNLFCTINTTEGHRGPDRIVEMDKIGVIPLVSDIRQIFSIVLLVNPQYRRGSTPSEYYFDQSGPVHNFTHPMRADTKRLTHRRWRVKVLFNR